MIQSDVQAKKKRTEPVHRRQTLGRQISLGVMVFSLILALMMMMNLIWDTPMALGLACENPVASPGWCAAYINGDSNSKLYGAFPVTNATRRAVPLPTDTDSAAGGAGLDLLSRFWIVSNSPVAWMGGLLYAVNNASAVQAFPFLLPSGYTCGDKCAVEASSLQMDKDGTSSRSQFFPGC
jgi:hypothetical protein